MTKMIMVRQLNLCISRLRVCGLVQSYQVNNDWYIAVDLDPNQG